MAHVGRRWARLVLSDDVAEAHRSLLVEVVEGLL